MYFLQLLKIFLSDFQWKNARLHMHVPSHLDARFLPEMGIESDNFSRVSNLWVWGKS